jgi:hypothetical protein
VIITANEARAALRKAAALRGHKLEDDCEDDGGVVMKCINCGCLAAYNYTPYTESNRMAGLAFSRECSREGAF